MADARLDLIAELQDNASRKLAELNNKINATAKTADSAGSRFSKLGDTIQASFQRSIQASQQFATALTAASVVAGAALIKYGDQVQNISNKIKSLSSTQEEATKNIDTLVEIAKRSRSPIESVVDTFQRFEMTNQTLGVETAKTMRMVETLTKGLQLSGATTGEASAAMLQLGQAYASGRLQGDEFRSLSETFPLFMLKMQQSLGVTRAELRDMAKDGEITREIMAKTLGDMATDVDNKFTTLPITIGQAFTSINNAIYSAARDIERNTGVFTNMSNAIASIARTIEESSPKLVEFITNLSSEDLAIAAGVVAGALTPAFIALAASVGSAVLALAPFMAAGALLVPLAVSIAQEYGITWNDVKNAITSAIDQGRKKIEELHAFYKNEVQPRLNELAKWFKENWQTIKENVMVAIEALEAGVKLIVAVWNNILKPALDGLVTFFKNNSKSIEAVWQGLWGTIKAILTTATALINGDWGKFWQGVSDIVTNVSKTIWSSVELLMNGIADGIVAGGKWVWEKLDQLFNNIADEFAKLADKALGWGGNMIQGFVDGITGKSQWATEYANKFASDIINTVTAKLEIHSPSRVFHYIGAQTIEGFILGMRSKHEKVREEATAGMEKVKEVFSKLSEDYVKGRSDIAETLEKLAADHKKSWDSMANDIENSRKAIQGFKKDYAGFVAGQGGEFGTKFIGLEQQLQSEQSRLQTLRVTGGSEQEIQDAQTKIAQLTTMYSQASDFLMNTKEQETNRIAELEASLAEKQRVLAMTNDLMRKAQITIELQDLQTKLDYAKIKEESFAETQRTLAEGVERARKTANMSEMELFLFNLMEKRVQEKAAMDEKIKAEEEKIKIISDSMVKEIDIYTAKMKEIKVRQDIMINLHKEFMEHQTKKTEEEINKQIEFYNRLAQAARDAYSAKATVGYFADGGIVPKYLATGGYARGTDTVPAMLTPGEVVLNAAQQKNLAGNIGGKTVNIYIDTMIGDESFAEKMGEKIIKQLQYSTAI